MKLATPGFPLCYDLNGDGVFNIGDYAADPRVNGPAHTHFCCFGDVNNPASSHNGDLLTPEDLIEVFSCFDAGNVVEPVGHFINVTPTGARQCDNGAQNVDNDGNGFPHDIAGWNFMEHTNDPFDEPHYGHGTGEARDSNAEANNGGDIGTCPSCMVLPLKVGDSFIADVNDFAQAVMYATDNQVNIVQQALGTLNNSSLNQAAIDYAYSHGVTVMSSAADESAGHHNQPAGSANHAVVVNSLRLDDAHDQLPSAPPPFPAPPPTGKTYLSLNGCTNYGGHIDISVPSASCSSEATGKSAGMAGLIYSLARNLVKTGGLTQYAAPSAGFPNGLDISPNEVKQVLTMTADDVNFEDASPSKPRGDSPADATSACAAPATPDPAGTADNWASGNAGSRYYSIDGFDQYFGYGRINASCAVRAVLAGRLPPEVDITSPRWWGNLDSSSTAPSFALVGRVAAGRATSYTYKVQIAYGVQPHESDWTTVYTSGNLTVPTTGDLAQGQLTPARIKAVMPATPGVTPSCGTHSVDANGDMADWLSPPLHRSVGQLPELLGRVHVHGPSPGRRQLPQPNHRPAGHPGERRGSSLPAVAARRGRPGNRQRCTGQRLPEADHERGGRRAGRAVQHRRRQLASDGRPAWQQPELPRVRDVERPDPRA